MSDLRDMDEEKYDLQSDNDACDQLWEIYGSEAKEYDEELVVRWKEDMDVILVFAGLYSAVITAFIIEGYSNLQPDQGEMTVQLLKRLSEQLASPGQEPSISVPDDSTFKPTTAAVVCNILWFLSLALTTTSALLAMLIQQWVRKFLHRTAIVRSARSQAYILKFLYSGIKEFRMHVLVELTPTLLHLSVLAFLGGLVAFVNDVNEPLKWCTIATMILAVGAYELLTILPILRINSPYATPLTPTTWRIAHILYMAWLTLIDPLGRRRSRDVESQEVSKAPSKWSKAQLLKLKLAKAIVVAAHEAKNPDQESNCIAWAFKSSNEEDQFLRLIEALPEALLNGDHIRKNNLHLLRPLVETTDKMVDVISRTLNLLRDSENSWISASYRRQCVSASVGVFYTLGRILVEMPDAFDIQKRVNPYETGPPHWFSLDIILALRSETVTSLDPLAQSAAALCATSLCQSTRAFLPSLSIRDASQICVELKRKLCGTRPDAITKTPSSPSPATYDQQSHELLQEAIDEVLLSVAAQYLHSAIKSYPQEFESVWNLLMHDGKGRRQGSASQDSEVEKPHLLDSSDTPYHFDQDSTSFRGDILLAAVTEVADQPMADYRLLISCLSILAEKGGRGATSKFWEKEERVISVVHVLQSSRSYPFSNSHHIILRELILHATTSGNEYLYSFLKDTRARLGNSELRYLISLAAIEISARTSEVSPAIAQINKLVSAELKSDSQLKDYSMPDQWKLLLQSFDIGLQHSEIKNILQYFNKFTLPRANIPPTAFSQPKYFLDLIHPTGNLQEEWLASPSEDLLDINTLIWNIWDVVLPSWTAANISPLTLNLSAVFGPDYAGPDIHAELQLLLSLSDNWLTKKAGEKIEAVEKAAPSQERYLIMEESSGTCRDLISAVNAARDQLLENFEFFIERPRKR